MGNGTVRYTKNVYKTTTCRTLIGLTIDHAKRHMLSLPEDAVIIIKSVIDVSSNSKTDCHNNHWHTCQQTTSSVVAEKPLVTWIRA